MAISPDYFGKATSVEWLIDAINSKIKRGDFKIENAGSESARVVIRWDRNWGLNSYFTTYVVGAFIDVGWRSVRFEADGYDYNLCLNFP